MRYVLARRLAPLLLVLLAAPALAERPAGGDRTAGEAARAERAFDGAPESFRSWVETLPPDQRRPLVRRLGRMPPARREHLFRRWEGASEADRERLQRRLEERSERRAERLRDPDRPRREGGPRARRPFPRRFDELTPEARERVAPLAERWRRMEPAERRRMRRRLEHFRSLSADEQAAVVDERYAERTPEERARILDALREASRALPERRPRSLPDE